MGLNDFIGKEETPIKILRVDPAVEKKVVERLNSVRKERSNLQVRETLNKLHKIAIQDAGGQNYILKLDTQEVIAGEPVVVIWNGVLFLRGGDKVLFKWMDASASDSLRCFLSWLRVVIE